MGILLIFGGRNHAALAADDHLAIPVDVGANLDVFVLLDFLRDLDLDANL
jgi:hypothetical protein